MLYCRRNTTVVQQDYCTCLCVWPVVFSSRDNRVHVILYLMPYVRTMSMGGANPSYALLPDTTEVGLPNPKFQYQIPQLSSIYQYYYYTTVPLLCRILRVKSHILFDQYILHATLICIHFLVNNGCYFEFPLEARW